MEVAAKLGTSLALSALSPLLNKLSSKIGGDVTAAEMKHLNDFIHFEIAALTREAKSDDLVLSTPLLEDLQTAALELEDLLDLYEYNQIEKQVSSSSSTSNCLKEFIRISIDWLRPILPKSPLRIGVEKLLEFVEKVRKIHPFITSRKGTTQPPANNITPKTSTPSSPFYGRGDQCDMIIKLLLDDSHADLNSRTKHVPIIAIRGLGGAGKTTIAQHVYNENKIENYFDLRMWVQVTRGFDERRLITEIIESAEKNACSQISNLDVLQTKLKDSVSKKKFLLVLDDVWEEDTARLDILLSPLNQVGVKGSRIVVTTRTEKAAKDLNAKPIILLDELQDEDCWSILKHYAFDDNEEIIEDHQELKYVGNQIISKVKHSPLALKVVGSSLRNKRSANEWEKILQQEAILKKDTMDLLLFSYQCLPLHLQRCFAYCSLFPKGYKFDFDVHSWQPHLISLWIAQGFIENTSELTLEEAGKEYIEELLSYSFFEKKYGILIDDHFVIHDLLHELAEKVSKKQCHRIEHYDSFHVPTTCIHLSWYITNNLVDVDMSHIVAIFDKFKLRNLRSLIILKRYGSKNIFKSRIDIFQNLTKLRTLYVIDQQMEVLSDPHIDKLKHLRYLHVRYDSKLPTSLTKLYQLRFFILTTSEQGDGSENLLANTLPQGFGNLFNLHILKFYTHDTNMELLHELAEKVSKKQCYRIEHYDSLHVPKTCIHLSFYITNNLVDVDMSHIVSISDIFKLRNLRSLIILKHDGSTNIFKSRKDISQNLTKLRALYVDEDQQMEVLNDPHIDNLKHLRYLHVQCDSKLPTSLTKLYQLQFFIMTTSDLVDGSDNLLANTLPQGFDNLFNLHILEFYNTYRELNYLHYNSEMINIEKLTSLQNLKKFYVDVFNGMIALRNLPLGGSLSILNLENVKCKKEAEEAMLNKKKNLNELTFKWNNKPSSIDICEEVLEGLEPHRNLEKLCIEGYQGVRFSNWMMKENWLPRLQALRLVSCTNIDLKGCGALSNLEKLSSLIDLYIADCPAIESLPNLPLSLRSITISRSPKFDLKGCGALSNLEKLSSLYITDCPAIESLPNLPLSLQSITISACPKFDLKGCGALSNLEKLSSLHELEIVDYPSTESLPNLSLSLQAITIIACPKFDLKGCGALSNLEKLSSLYIKKCPAIESLPNLPLSLQNFVIWGCPKFDLKGCGALSNLEKLSFLGIGNCYAIESLSNLPLSLPNFAIWGCPKFDLKGCGALSNLEKLSSLYITDCPAIESLPNLPLSLESLHIRECPKLKLKYEEGGPFRNTISHIPKIYID